MAPNNEPLCVIMIESPDSPLLPRPCADVDADADAVVRTGLRRAVASPWVRRIGSTLVVVGLASVMLPRLAGFSAISQSIGSMSWPMVVLLAVAAAWNLASYGFVLTAATPGLSFSQAFVVTQSSTAVANTVPGGGAMGVGVMAGMYRSWGFSPASTSLAVVATGIWNTLVKLSVPVVVLALLLVTGGATVGSIVGASIGLGIVVGTVVLTVSVLRDDRVARRVAKLAGRCVSRIRKVIRRGPVLGWEDAASAFRREADAVLRGRWLRLTASTVASQASLFAVLFLAMRGVGIGADQVGWVAALSAFAFVRLLSIVPVSPGGVGVVEVGLGGALISAGAPEGAAVAAVLVFRTLTYLAPVVAGLPSYVVWRRCRRWRQGPSVGDLALAV